jgi:hypothetical protein
VIDEVLELVVDHLARLVGPDELVLRVEDERQLVHLRLVEGVGLRVDVRGVDADVPRRAAQPLPAVLPAQVLALRQRLPRQRLRVAQPRRLLPSILRRRQGRRLSLLHLLLLGTRRRQPDAASRRPGAREPAPLQEAGQLGRAQKCRCRGRHSVAGLCGLLGLRLLMVSLCLFATARPSCTAATSVAPRAVSTLLWISKGYFCH